MSTSTLATSPSTTVIDPVRRVQRQMINQITFARAAEVSDRTIRAWEASGVGPQPVRLGPKAVGYYLDEVEAFLAAGAPRRRPGRPRKTAPAPAGARVVAPRRPVPPRRAPAPPARPAPVGPAPEPAPRGCTDARPARSQLRVLPHRGKVTDPPIAVAPVPMPLPEDAPPTSTDGTRWVWAADVRAGRGRWVLFQATCPDCMRMLPIVYPEATCKPCAQWQRAGDAEQAARVVKAEARRWAIAFHP